MDEGWTARAADDYGDSERQEREANAALVSQLPADHPVRRVAMEILHQSLRPGARLTSVFGTLMFPSASHWRERTVAAWCLGRVPLSAADAEITAGRLGDVLDDWMPEDRTGRGIKRCFSVAWWLSFSITLLSVFTANRTEEMANAAALLGTVLFAAILAVIGMVPLALVCAPFVMPVSFASDKMRANHIRAAAAASLGRLRVPHSLTSLAHAVNDLDPKVSRAARAALLNVLSVVTPEHYGQLGRDAATSLCNVLSIQDEEFNLALLEALGKIGDGRVVENVEHVAAWGQTARIQVKAAEILPILRERRRQENDPKRLLRATDAPERQEKHLLRPARSIASEPDRLLRPASAQEANPSIARL